MHQADEPHYRHKVAAADHPSLSSNMAIWSFSVQVVCAIGQFPGIRMPLLYSHATSVKATFDHQKPTFLETGAFPMVDATLCMQFIQLFIQ